MRRRQRSLFALSLVAAIAARADSGELFRRGDANLDGGLEISDAVAGLFGLFVRRDALRCDDAADADDDGRLSIADPLRILGQLFLAGPSLPPPSGRCPGRDLSEDDLGCAGGAEAPLPRPRAAVWAEPAPPEGAGERLGTILPESAGVYRIPAGRGFALFVESDPDWTSRARVALEDPLRRGQGDPEALRVVCDRDLGPPEAGGLAAGTNLAPRFLEMIRLWREPILLSERAALRWPPTDAGPFPEPGRYRFRIEVADATCAVSDLRTLELEITPPADTPDLQIDLEGILSDLPDGEQRPGEAIEPADPATGGLMLASTDRLLFVQARPRGLAAIDVSSLSVRVDPPLFAGDAPEADLAPRFRSLGPHPTGVAQWSFSLDQTDPLPGNHRLRVEVASADGARGRLERVLEVPVSYAGAVQPIWDSNCGGCHEKPDVKKGLELVQPGASPSRLRTRIAYAFAAEPAFDSAAPLLVWPYRPERSYLLHKLRGTQAAPDVLGEGDRMPADGPPFLSDESLQLIESWVAQGAPDN